MNKPQREYLKTLSRQIEKVYFDNFGKPDVYIVPEKRKVPKEMSIGGFDVTAEKVTYPVNHFRRLKRGFLKQGVDGVCNYLKGQGFKHDKKLLEIILNNG